MKKIMISPSKYVQGSDVICDLGDYASVFGKKILMIAHKDDFKRVETQLKNLDNKGITMIYSDFGGECTRAEIKKCVESAKNDNCDVIVGLGGGKALDTAKAAANEAKLPVIVVPTIASTDAPCSSLAVVYTENGAFDEYYFFNQNPNVVIADTKVIAKAPKRFLASGIGDALATYFEARACQKSAQATNIPGGKSTIAAFAISKACYDTLIEDGEKAMFACDAGVVTKSLENIVEANILLSGLGFESCGLAAAHAVHDGLTQLEETHHYFHGEKVAFGVIVQLVLENAPKDELKKITEFCKSLNLPICLEDLGITDVTHEKLSKVAKAACDPSDTMANMPFVVTEEDVIAAILSADKYGRSCK